VFEQSADSRRTITSTAPLPQFAEHTRVASANIYPDSDGIVRRLARVELWAGTLVPTMAAAAAGLQPTAMSRYYVDFGIDADQIKRVSFVDVLHDKVDPSVFAGKIVMIGATARELGDTVATPVGGCRRVRAGPGDRIVAAEPDLHKVSRWLILAIACMLFFLIEAIAATAAGGTALRAGAGAPLPRRIAGGAGKPAAMVETRYG
jgi:CHASE2 domain-containing sensor protein